MCAHWPALAAYQVSFRNSHILNNFSPAAGLVPVFSFPFTPPHKHNPDLSLMTSLCPQPYLGIAMWLDILYVLIGLAFFAVCWLFTKACDHL